MYWRDTQEDNLSGLLQRLSWRQAEKPRMGKSSAEERFTLLFVSSRGRSRTLGFSVRTLKIIAGTALILTAAFVIFLSVFRANSKELSELRYMREVADSQKQQIQSLQEQYSALNERLQQAETYEAQIQAMLDSEGIVQKENYIPGADNSRAGVRLAPVISRDQTGETRLGTPDDMGRALYALATTAGDLQDKTSTIVDQAKTLHGQVSEVVARLRATPSIWPAKGDISSDFGWRANPFRSHSSEYHDGIDIAASYGDPILATADGTVVFSGYKYGYGWCVTIQHGYGLETLYAHCSSLKVSKWQKVKRGDVIARVGDSGSSTGPHLHYQVNLWGTPVDPTDYLHQQVLEVKNSVR